MQAESDKVAETESAQVDTQWRKVSETEAESSWNWYGSTSLQGSGLWRPLAVRKKFLRVCSNVFVRISGPCAIKCILSSLVLLQ